MLEDFREDSSLFLSKGESVDYLLVKYSKKLLSIDPISDLAYNNLKHHIIENIIMRGEEDIIDCREAVSIVINWIDYHVKDVESYGILLSLFTQLEMNYEFDEDYIIEIQGRISWWCRSILRPYNDPVVKADKTMVELVVLKCNISVLLFGPDNSYKKSVLEYFPDAKQLCL
eukprot:TRINITY_DN5166_c0_g1_i1.p1 TRINITY_DN5166_c0_g1~~TRINITY_DN5166_c0_g1_i1.p1  ORF type:complete len:172 (-),score=13.77 TRINITY_DN5166_c0_g1_i1:75-590(-)